MLRFVAVHEPDLAAEPTVVLMIPLLFEAGLEEQWNHQHHRWLCSEIWLVDCDEAQQLERLMQRDGLSSIEAEARIHAQWPLAKKRPLSDVLIDNRVSIRSEGHLKKGIQTAL